MSESTVYICEFPACSLGTVGAPGRFAGGISAESLSVLTGEPVEAIEDEGKAGEGYCPNCGTKGRKAGKDD